MANPVDQLPIDLPSAAVIADWPDGSAVAPSQKFANAKKTGIYFDNGGIGTTVDGVRKATITNFGLDLDGVIHLQPMTAPTTPTTGASIYFDSADNQIKFRENSGNDIVFITNAAPLEYSTEFKVIVNGNNAIRATSSAIILGDANSYTIPNTRGLAGQFLMSDGIGGTAWTDQRDTFLLSNLTVPAGTTKTINVSALGAGFNILGAGNSVSVDEMGVLTTGDIVGSANPDITGFNNGQFNSLTTEDINLTGLSLMNITAAGSLTVAHNSIERLYIDGTTVRLGTPATGWNIDLTRGTSGQVLASDGFGGSSWISLSGSDSLYSNDGTIPTGVTRNVGFDIGSSLNFVDYLTISSTGGGSVHVGPTASGWNIPLDRPVATEYLRSSDAAGNTEWRDFNTDVRNNFSVTGSLLTYNSATGEFSTNAITDDFSLFTNDGTLTSLRTVNLDGNEILFTQPGSAGTAVLRLEADNDDSNESATPQIMLNSDARLTYVALGIAGTNDQHFSGTKTNGGYLYSDFSFVFGAYEERKFLINDEYSKFYHRLEIDTVSNSRHSIELRSTSSAFGYLGFLNSEFYVRSDAGDIRINKNNTDVAVFDGTTAVFNTPASINGNLTLGYAGDGTFNQILTSKSGALGYLGFYENFMIIRSDVTDSAINIQNNGSTSLRITAAECLVSPALRVNNTTQLNGALTLGNPGSNTFSTTLTNIDGDLGYVGFYNDNFVVRSDVSNGFVRIQNEGSTSASFRATTINMNRPTTFADSITINGALDSAVSAVFDGSFTTANTCDTTFNSNVLFKNDLVVRNVSNNVVFQANNGGILVNEPGGARVFEANENGITINDPTGTRVIFQADDNGITANEKLTIGHQGIGLPQLAFVDDDGAEAAFVRVIANNDISNRPYGREALLIHAATGQAGMICLTENGGDFLWVHDSSTITNFSRPSMRLYHPNVGVSDNIVSPELLLGGPGFTSAAIQLTADIYSSKWLQDVSGNTIFSKDSVDMISLGLQTMTVNANTMSLNSTNSATFTIAADTDNSGEEGVPQIALRQDGGNLAIRMGGVGSSGSVFPGTSANSAYIEAGNEMQIRSSNSLAQTISGNRTTLENAIIKDGSINNGVTWEGQDFGDVTSAAAAGDSTPSSSSYGAVNLGSFQVRWGMVTSSNDAQQTFYFGEAFSTNCMIVVLTNRTVGTRNAMSLLTWNRTRFYIDRDNAQDGSLNVSYIAFGY